MTTLREGYLFLRRVESGLRLMNTAARHELPIDQLELHRLAYVLGLESETRVDRMCLEYRTAIRNIFETIFEVSGCSVDLLFCSPLIFLS